MPATTPRRSSPATSTSRAWRRYVAAAKPPFIGCQAFADGQHPFSLANLRAVRALADREGLRLVLDVSRVIENAWYVQRHEPGMADRTIAEIVKSIAKTAHVILMDGAQDPRANTGGFLATDNPADHEHFINDVVLFEGLHTYGGMAGRTMEVLARGLVEMCDEAGVQWVMHQTERFAERLRAAGVPLERGCDGAYVKAAEFLPQDRRAPGARARLRALPDLRRARPGPGSDRPRHAAAGPDPAPGDDQLAARPGRRRADRALPPARPGGAARGRAAAASGTTSSASAPSSPTSTASPSTASPTSSTPSSRSPAPPASSARGRSARRAGTPSCSVRPRSRSTC